ncbi:MAG: 3-phosphoshikimate 1-carboxyvinyltransferase, partial [Erysipelotrichaceae bacterium]
MKTIQVNSSKSIAHRSIICASLSNKTSTISHVDFCDDVNATIECLKALGTTITIINDQVIVNGSTTFTKQPKVIDVNESGSTLRFLIPLILLHQEQIIIKTSNNLINRPLDVYEQLFNINKKGQEIHISGKLTNLNIKILGNISSQFITGLLFALPLLPIESTLSIIEPYESKQYVHLTIDILNKYGITINQNNNIYNVLPNQQYHNYDIE